MDGMGYWFPDHKVGYFSPVPFSVPSDIIFYFEALCVAAALECAHLSTADGARILIYTDNMNTVDIFNSLRCKPEYNPILCFAVDILIDGDHDLRVLHVPGEANVVADALSRRQFTCALALPDAYSQPRVKEILDFTPPQLALGAAKK